jgi:hypothetical protein
MSTTNERDGCLSLRDHNYRNESLLSEAQLTLQLQHTTPPTHKIKWRPSLAELPSALDAASRSTMPSRSWAPAESGTRTASPAASATRGSIPPPPPIVRERSTARAATAATLARTASVAATPAVSCTLRYRYTPPPSEALHVVPESCSAFPSTNRPTRFKSCSACPPPTFLHQALPKWSTNELSLQARDEVVNFGSAPAPAPAPAPAAAGGGGAFCSGCGTKAGGGRFCSGCGNAL